jgi:membrane associated rhomboid family serine protease
MADQMALRASDAPATSLAAEPEPLPRTWEELFPRRPKPEFAEYGFLSARGNAVPSTRERLLHLARTEALPPLVWTPETPEMVPPWEVPYLREPMREQVISATRRELRIVYEMLGVLAAAGLLALALAGPMALLFVAVIGALLGGVARSVRGRLKAAERLSADDFRRGLDAVVEQQAEAGIPIPATQRVGMSLIAVGVCQILLPGTSIEAGGVSLQAVAAGEWWRLFTAPMLHGGILHFWMNYGALESLGRTIETRGVRAYLPLVFLSAALAGGVFSILIPPASVSVGASGGLMGMFGFLGVMGWRRTDLLPEGFLRALMINVAIIALVGLIAYRFIDNAAHAGGLLAGVLLGLAAVPRGNAEWVETPALRRTGWIAQGVIFASAALAIVLTLRAFLV